MQAQLWKRLGWMALIWGASVAVLAVLSFGIKFWIG